MEVQEHQSSPFQEEPCQARDRVDTPLPPTRVQTIAKSRPYMASGSVAVSAASRTGLLHPHDTEPEVRMTVANAAWPPRWPGLRLS